MASCKYNCNGQRFSGSSSSSRPEPETETSWYEDYMDLKDEFRCWDLRVRTQEAAVAVDFAEHRLKNAIYRVKDMEKDLIAKDSGANGNFRYLLDRVKEDLNEKKAQLESLKSELRHMQWVIGHMDELYEMDEKHRTPDYRSLPWTPLTMQIPNVDKRTAYLLAAVTEILSKYSAEMRKRETYSRSYSHYWSDK